MTFQEIVERIADRLAIPASQTASINRISRSVNDIYREVTTAIGVDLSRHSVAVTASTSLGIQTVTFSGVEKIERLINDTSGSVKIIPEVTFDQIRNLTPAASDTITKYAVESWTSTTVTIRLDVLPQTVFTLKADGFASATTLSGINEPAFPASFHDILIDGVLAEEYIKLEKTALSDRALARFEKRLSDLRMWRAKSISLTIRQSETRKTSSLSSATGSGGGGSGTSGGTSYEQTGLITFNRDPSAPFAVTSSSAVVTNLDADLLDGLHASAFAVVPVDLASQVTGDLPLANIAQIATDRLLGRDTAGTGDLEAISVTGGLEFTGSASIQTAAFTGDVTKAAGGTVLTIPNDTVTYAKMQNVSAASRVLGRGSNAGSGDIQELSIGSNLSITDTDFNLATNIAVAGTLGVTGAITATAGQIIFPATQNPSTNVNTLDDYEEGTWTPTLGGSGGTSGQSYNARSGRYVKIGKLVFVVFDIQMGTKGTLTGNLEIQGLPFPNENVSSAGATNALLFQNMASSFVQVLLKVQGNASSVSLLGIAAAATSNNTALTTSAILDTVIFQGAFTYITTA